jgi:hypothetical protein
MKIQIFRFLVVGVLLLSILTPPVSVHAAGITVTNREDSGPGSLRQAIINAMAGGGAEITFSVNGTITLDSQLPEINIDGGLLIINGTGHTVTISGRDTFGVLVISPNTSLELNNLTIANGYTTSGEGGGITNYGSLHVTNVTFSGNHAEMGGGAINNIGTAFIMNSTFYDNSVSLSYPGGGAIYNNIPPAYLTVTNSTFSGNIAGASGGSGIYNFASTVIISNTILANAPSAGNCAFYIAAITNGGNNIDDGTSCGWASTNGSLSSTDPLLGPLADNGGSTWTFALLTGSPAIDGVTYNPPNAAPPMDQRGIDRPHYAGYDIGSFEYVQFHWISLPLVLRN